MLRASLGIKLIHSDMPTTLIQDATLFKKNSENECSGKTRRCIRDIRTAKSGKNKQ